jgi:hypothetical protein
MSDSTNAYRTYKGDLTSSFQSERLLGRLQENDHLIINQSKFAVRAMERVKDTYVPSDELWEAWKFALGEKSTELCLFACRFNKREKGKHPVSFSPAMEQQVLNAGAERLAQLQELCDDASGQLDASSPDVNQAKTLEWDARRYRGEAMSAAGSSMEELLLRFRQLKETYESFEE